MTLFYAWEHGMGCTKVMPKEEELQQLPARGKLDWKPLLHALKDISFVGPTEIFMHPTPRGIPIFRRPLKPRRRLSARRSSRRHRQHFLVSIITPTLHHSIHHARSQSPPHRR
jgi:hypothetical protein